jgi:hypothetical protein
MQIALRTLGASTPTPLLLVFIIIHETNLNLPESTMSNNAVGLGFETDVVGRASVMHLLTGRLLKTLIDRGVDAYAVASSIWLGTQFKTRSELEATVHPHLEARLSQGFQGFLAKILSIGWGHSGAAVEMSRTKAGTNSLVLIGALAAGSPPFLHRNVHLNFSPAMAVERTRYPMWIV